MLQRVLIANRGAIACRIIRTLKRLGIESIAVYSEADFGSLHVTAADKAICLGAAAASESYLNVPRILEAAHKSRAEAIHPGYGFLSENAEFAAACEDAGIVFLGPTPEQISAFGLKNTARDIAVACHAPILPGTDLLVDLDDAFAKARGIGYPVMLKSAGGGGGIGMRRCNDEVELRGTYDSVLRLSETHFKGSGIFLEKFVSNARHIEVQAFGDGRGVVIALGERDCSVQRRNQKIIEETPAIGISDEVREDLQDTAVRILQSVNYRSAGTVEFLYDQDTGAFYFLEVNSRLQVEHGVTEEVWGLDIVEAMVRLGGNEPVLLASLRSHGHSLQVRLYAEDPLRNFQPSSGRVTRFDAPGDVRCDTWVETGTDVTPYYDPLLAKIIVKGATRAEALQRMQTALSETRLDGIATNLEFLRAIVGDRVFATGEVTTAYLNTLAFAPAAVQVIEAGVMSILQQYPGRLGYWAVGVPPSGPMDSVSFRLANRLLGNPSTATALECTMAGPTLRFVTATRIAITGADMQPKLDGESVPLWSVVDVQAGSTLTLSTVRGPGTRTYIATKGGFNVAEYLGSATTFTLGKFGGLTGRQIAAGDTLPLIGRTDVSSAATCPQPELTNNWEVGVLYGPQGAPDFFTEDDIETFFSVGWRVHHNSSRTGVRLIGPKPKWARADGGDAGLHPSNLHDNAYAVGAVDFTGDMPVVLGPDGPSLGGFVCPAVVVDAELWKLGQLTPGDTVRFRRLTVAQAHDLGNAVQRSLDTLTTPLPTLPPMLGMQEGAVIHRAPGTVARAQGDRSLLIEFGDPALDLTLRVRAHALMTALAAQEIEGIIDLTPGIRSLQIHYDTQVLSRETVLRHVDDALDGLPDTSELAVPSRIVHLPLSWDDPATRLAIERYVTSVRVDAPWCPSNLEFIRRINGLSSIDDVYRIVFEASYLVLGLGDVYLGAPVATPVDPRHRLVTTKYNPARTWTPENAVGIGGAYLCVYGMEGPGGYQFVGRTVQMWNTHRVTKDFAAGSPWLLRFFDQVRFHPVSAEELLEQRRAFPLGRFKLQIEEETFRFGDYQRYLRSIDASAAVFRTQQVEAFTEERRRWTESGEFDRSVDEEFERATPASEIPYGCAAILAPTTASVWRVEVEAGMNVAAGQRVVMLEAMKMEIAVTAPAAGEVVSVLCTPGGLVSSGQPLLVYRSNE